MNYESWGRFLLLNSFFLQTKVCGFCDVFLSGYTVKKTDILSPE